MKTKEELLKIYSVLLPYELGLNIENEVETDYTMFLGEMDSIMPGNAVLAGITKETSYMPECILYTRNDGEADGYIQIKNVKPILYSMDMLTKPIEHKGERFIPVDKFEIGDDDSGIEYDHGNIGLIKDLESISKHNSYHDVQFLPYEVVQRLISWHFNVFGLDESEYIKKKI